MNTLTKGFAKRVISALLATIMVFSLGIVGLTSASAANVDLAETGGSSVASCTIIFDNSQTKWSSSYMYFVYGDSNYSHCIQLTKISNTNLYYTDSLNAWSGGGVTYYGVVNTTSSWSSGNWSSSNLENASGYTAAYTNTYNLDSGKMYLVNPSSSGNGCSFTFSPQDSYTNLNHQQNAKVCVQSGSSYAVASNSNAGTVKISGYGLNSDHKGVTASSSTTSYSVSFGACRGSVVTLTATAKTGYEFVGWSSTSNGSNIVSTNTTYTYTSQEYNKTYYACFKPSVSFSSATATIDTNSIVVGNSADITVDYTCTSTATPTYTLCDGNGNAITSGYTLSGNVFTVTPTVAQNYVYKVKISVNGVSTFTNTVELVCKKEYSASLSVDNNTQYTDEVFTFTIDDNSELYDNVKYEVYCDDTAKDITVTDNTFTVSHATAGTYTYHVVATVDGEEVNTNEVEITVKAKEFSVYLTAPKSTMEDRAFTITASVEFAPDGSTLQYVLTGTDGSSYTSADGNFANVIGDCPEDAESIDVTYTITVTATDAIGTVVKTVTDTAKVTITKDYGTYPIRILFKCSDTYGYLPNMSVKINGNEAQTIERQKYTVIESRPNATDTATYSWYFYEIPDVDYGTDIVFSANATRNYFYNASITLKAGQGDFEMDGTYYCYYLALENLNGGTSVLSNISKLTEAERNWTESAVNMIYDDADAKAPVGVNFAYADMADANTDGKVNIKDATYIQKSLANVVEASALSTSVSDVNGDGKVTIKDATALQKQLANL